VEEDQADVRSGIARLNDLRAFGGKASSAKRRGRSISTFTSPRELKPDVVLMDIRMPKLDGIAATRKLLAKTPAPRVLVLTTFGEDDYVYEAMRAGASGFLLKDSERRHLLQAVRVVADGDELLDASITRRLIERLTRRPPRIEGTPAELGGLASVSSGVTRLVAGAVERGDRRGAGRLGGDRQEPGRGQPAEAGPPRPRPDRDPRLRVRFVEPGDP
jgi:DNA-binding NarL/FixJ family response regulator